MFDVVTMSDEDSRVVAGVDLGGTNLRVAVADQSGSTAGFLTCPTEAFAGPDVIIDRIVSMIRQSLVRANVEATELVAVGVGAPGPLDSVSGVIHNEPTNLPGWNGIRLADRLSEVLGVPVFLEKDANVAALAECVYGRNCGVANMLYITVSTGVGAGLILNGELWQGVHGTAGEFGHMTVDFEGPLCDCGNRGCIQEVASGPNIAAWVLSKISAGAPSIVTEISVDGPVSGRDVVRAAVDGDELAIAGLDRAGRAVGFGIVSLAHMVNLELVVVGGGIANAGALLLDPIIQTVRGHVLGSTASSLRVVPWSIGEEVGGLGAVASAYSRMGSGREFSV
mgnify:CR=1 FL=1